MDDPYGVLPPIGLNKSPVIYGQQIYFPSSLSHRNKFMENPIKYISQMPPGPTVPVTVSIVGPPKSGKTASKIITMHELD